MSNEYPRLEYPWIARFFGPAKSFCVTGLKACFTAHHSKSVAGLLGGKAQAIDRKRLFTVSRDTREVE